jgi:predicted AAA+ superfamily ATPase
LTGGRQIGKSTSCKQLIQHCLETESTAASQIFYLPCDEIFDATELGTTIRSFLSEIANKKFLLIIDEITYVKNWERVIKAIADEGYFNSGLCILTGSDTLILKEAAMSFPGRRGKATISDFHLYPLTFPAYAKLKSASSTISNEQLQQLFQNYLLCGGYLRAINDLEESGAIAPATFVTYEQWIRGDILKQGKNEETLLAILLALFTIGVSQISYSSLTQKIGLISKETCIDYCRLLQRLDLLFDLQAFDQNKKQGFPRKARKFHFFDPFIYRTIFKWLQREGYLANEQIVESNLVEAVVASHCHRQTKTFYFKGDGEVDVIWLKNNVEQAIEVKWTNQLRPADLKMLKHFKNSVILTKSQPEGMIENIAAIPVWRFLFIQ